MPACSTNKQGPSYHLVALYAGWDPSDAFERPTLSKDFTASIRSLTGPVNRFHCWVVPCKKLNWHTTLWLDFLVEAAAADDIVGAGHAMPFACVVSLTLLAVVFFGWNSLLSMQYVWAGIGLQNVLQGGSWSPAMLSR